MSSYGSVYIGIAFWDRTNSAWIRSAVSMWTTFNPSSCSCQLRPHHVEGRASGVAKVGGASDEFGASVRADFGSIQNVVMVGMPDQYRVGTEEKTSDEIPIGHDWL